MSNYIEVTLFNWSMFTDKEIDKIKKYAKTENSENKKKWDTLIGKNSKFKIPILEDLPLETNSSFQTLDAIFNIAGRISGILSQVNSMSGSASAGSLSNIFTYEMWQKTEPLSINFKTILYTKTNPFLDVWLPTILLTSQSIISQIPANNGKIRYKLPGISLGSIRQQQENMRKSLDSAQISSNQVRQEGRVGRNELQQIIDEGKTYEKLCNVRIPGILQMSPCMIVSAKPVFSKQTINILGKPFPIWSEIEMQIKSVSPASSKFFTDEILSNPALEVKTDPQSSQASS